MTSPSEQKGQQSRNALNVRIGCRRGFTVPLGPYESERVEFSAELDLPSDKTLTDGLSELDACLQDLQAEARKKYQQQKPQVQAQQIASTGRSAPSSPQSLSVETLGKLEWRFYKSGHRASWIFTDKAPKELLDALEKNGSLELGEFRYRFSGPQESPRLFVSRAPLKD